MSLFQQRTLDLVESRQDQTKIFIYAFIAWFGLFVIIDRKLPMKKMQKKLADDIKNRIISMVHGSLTFWGAFYIITNFSNNFSEQNTYEISFLMIVSSAYFVYDLLACIYTELSDTTLLVHHALAISGYVSAILAQFGGIVSITGLFAAEVSNFPMHLRIILRNLNLRYTLAYEVCELSYFFLYITFRGIFVPQLLWGSWREPSCPLFVKLCATGIFLQSLYFIFEMKRIIIRLRKQQLERKKLGIQYQWFAVSDAVLQLSYTRRVQKDAIF